MNIRRRKSKKQVSSSNADDDFVKLNVRRSRKRKSVDRKPSVRRAKKRAASNSDEVDDADVTMADDLQKGVVENEVLI